MQHRIKINTNSLLQYVLSEKVIEFTKKQVALS